MEIGALSRKNLQISSGEYFGFLDHHLIVSEKSHMVFHLFVNFMQEKIDMTPETKCVETIVVTVATVIIVLANKEIFFETDHIGKLPEYKQKI